MYPPFTSILFTCCLQFTVTYARINVGQYLANIDKEWM